MTRKQQGHPQLLALPQRLVRSLLEMTDGEVAAVAVDVRNAGRLI